MSLELKRRLHGQELGGWEESKAVALEPVEGKAGMWRGQVVLPIPCRAEFKLVEWRPKSGECCSWEAGANHRLMCF